MNAETCVEEIREQELKKKLESAITALEVLESHYKLIEKHHPVIPLKDMLGYQHLKDRINEPVSQMSVTV